MVVVPTTTGRGERTGADSREDGIEDEDAVRAAIENAARAMREARREANVERVRAFNALQVRRSETEGTRERERRTRRTRL